MSPTQSSAQFSNDENHLLPISGKREDNLLQDDTSMLLNSTEVSEGNPPLHSGPPKLPCKRLRGCCKSIRKYSKAMGKKIKELVACGGGRSAARQGRQGRQRDGLHNAVSEEEGPGHMRVQPMTYDSHETPLLQSSSNRHPTIEHNSLHDATTGGTRGDGGSIVQSTPNYGVGGHHNGSGTQTIGSNTNINLVVNCSCLLFVFAVVALLPLYLWSVEKLNM